MRSSSVVAPRSHPSETAGRRTLKLRGLTGLVPAALTIIVFAIVSILVSGYRLDDLLIYLPMTAYLREPALYPNDPLISQLLAMPYPLYRAYALAYDQWVLFAMFAVSRCALIASLWCLGRTLAESRGSVALGIALLVFTPGWFGTLGGTSLLQSEASQFDIATPLCIFALAAALARRHVVALVTAALALDMQPILGAIVMGLIASDLLINQVYRERAVSPRSALAMLVLGACLALPEVVWTIAGLGTRLTEQPPDYVEIVRFTAFYQIFPDTFPREEWFGTVCVLIAATAALCAGVARSFSSTLGVWVLVVVAACVVGTVFSELVPIGLVLKLMPFRSTLFVKVIGLLLVGGLVWRRVLRRRRSVQLLLTVAALLVTVWLVRPFHIPGVSPASDLELAAAWARAQTPRDALFVTSPDPSSAGFMLFSERSTLGDYKLDTQAVWDPQFAHTAYLRLVALGCAGPWNPWCFRNRYAAFGVAEFEALSRDFGTCYALTSRSQDVSLPVAYENGSYRIYALCASAVSAG